MVNESNHLYIKNTSGTTQTINLYTTPEEVNNNYISIKVGDTTYYAALVDINDPYASSCRIKKNDTTYAIGTAIIPEYGSQLFTSTGTFTVPDNIYSCRVTCVGGGAGGATGYVPSGTNTIYFDVQGGITSFGSLCSANGGSRPYVVVSNSSVSSYTNSAGYNSGGYYYGSVDFHGGGSAVPLINISGTTVGSYGSGGGCDENNGGRVNFSGASGYRTITIVSVKPKDVITVTIGAGGNNYGRGGYYNYNHSSKGYGATVGSSGACLVEWGKGTL